MMSFQDYRDWGGKGGVSTRQWCVRSAPKSPMWQTGGLSAETALLSAQQNPGRCLQAGGGSLKVTYSLPTISGGDAVRWALHSLQSPAGRACSPVLPVRGFSPFALGWKELQMVCRQLGYLCVCIIWTGGDCRVPLFYLIFCLEASSDLIMAQLCHLACPACRVALHEQGHCAQAGTQLIIDTDSGYRVF